MAALPPTFPKGLRVLLVDGDHTRPAIEAQLRQPELQYVVTSCGNSTEALGFSRAAARSFDVVLAESKLVASDEVTGRAFVDAFEDVPVVLMSEGGATDEVMRAVTLGAVDFLDKPLSVLKLKNIWQHSVRRMMQRASLFDPPCQTPAYSEPTPNMAQQPSLSNCLPSSMTAPLALAAPLRISGDKAATAPHRSSVDSPGTPSAGDCEPAESVSAGSVHQLNDAFFSSLDASMDPFLDSAALLDLETSSLNKTQQAQQQQQQQAPTRPPLACKPSSFGPLVPAPPVSQWPQLPSGCVWGTPVGGPLPPPLSAPTNNNNTSNGPQPMNTCTGAGPSHLPLLRKQRSFATAASDLSLPSLCTAPDTLPPCTFPVPDGFLSLTQAKEDASSGGGPIGLKLRKSNSLLELINATLAMPPVAAAGGFTEPRTV